MALVEVVAKFAVFYVRMQSSLTSFLMSYSCTCATVFELYETLSPPLFETCTFKWLVPRRGRFKRQTASSYRQLTHPWDELTVY